MRIKNKPYKELNDKEREVVRKHFDRIGLECYKLHKDVMDFWEAHREVDTDNGKYDGWVE